MSLLGSPCAGYIFSPQRWARDNLGHPPHVMSDHILLAAAVHGGLVCEALLPLLNWRHTVATGAPPSHARAARFAAAMLHSGRGVAPCSVCRQGRQLPARVLRGGRLPGSAGQR